MKLGIQGHTLGNGDHADADRKDDDGDVDDVGEMDSLRYDNDDDDDDDGLTQIRRLFGFNLVVGERLPLSRLNTKISLSSLSLLSSLPSFSSLSSLFPSLSSL